MSEIEHSAPAASSTSFFRREIVALLVLCLLVFLAWCIYYARWPGTADFAVPTCYKGDALLTMGVVKGFSELPPFYNVEVKGLGAPFAANWNDYPLSEKLVYYPIGLLARFIDPGVGANIDLILAHLLAAIAFYIAARYFGAGRVIAVGFSLFYALSSYIFMRGLSHLILSYCWNIPLMLVVIDQGLKARSERATWAKNLAIFLVVCTGLMSPYYWFFFLALSALVGCIWIARGSWRESAFSFFSVFGLIAVFFIGQIGFYLSAWRNGPNTDALVRSLPALLENGLRLPSLIWPATHVIQPWAKFAQHHYFSQSGPMVVGEGSTPFLGIVGVIGLILMVGFCFIRAARGRWQTIPTEAWAAIFALAFATIGGLDYLLGSFGFVMLRSVNRYSIIILACVLLFMAARLWPRLHRWTGYSLLAVLLFLSAWELSGLRKSYRPEWGWYRSMTLSDRSFAKELDQKLPQGAMVFTLPCWIFPEAPAVYHMGDYDHFRSYIWSNHIRLSYGSDRGRRREEWQSEAAEQPPAEMVHRLEKAGFSAVLIERKAYPDNAAQLEAGLKKAGLSILADAPDQELVAYGLHPASQPELPLPEKPELLLGGNFYPWENAKIDGAPKQWAWSSYSAKLHVLATPGSGLPSVLLTFKLTALHHRTIDIFLDDHLLGSTKLQDGEARYVSLQWTPTREQSVIYLRTDRPGTKPPLASDPRDLAFCVFDPQLTMTSATLTEPQFVLSEKNPPAILKK